MLQAGIVVATVAMVICGHLLSLKRPGPYRAWQANAKEPSTFQPSFAI
jgi:hypothetical protein